MPPGGSRIGAGRPKGQGKYGVKTKAIRVPEDRIAEIIEYISSGSTLHPLYSSNVSAGFPLPADDYIEDMLDLNKYLIHNSSSTFFVRASGDSMIGAGIYSGDVLVVDRSIEPKSGKIIIAAIDGNLTVKRLEKSFSKTILRAENPQHSDIEIEEGNELIIWGVVTSVLHKV